MGAKPQANARPGGRFLRLVGMGQHTGHWPMVRRLCFFAASHGFAVAAGLWQRDWRWRIVAAAMTLWTPPL